MTSRQVEVVAVEAGVEVARLPLGHGDSPQRALARAGWRPLAAPTVASAVVGGVHRLSFSFQVTAGGGAQPAPAGPERRDAGLVVGPDEAPVVVQRVAAYADVRSERGVLLTEFSELTKAPGTWGLAGGGLDPLEDPADAVVREVWEETGQRVRDPQVVGLTSGHWLGRSPTGVLEDFHAVRVLYRADCPEPTEPQVHDRGGTTRSAAWVPLAELARLPVTPVWRDLMRQVGLPVDA